MTTPRAYPLRDESLPHQIVMLQRGVSCNCRSLGPNRGFGQSHETFAKLGTVDEALAAYRNPANHRGTFP